MADVKANNGVAQEEVKLSDDLKIAINSRDGKTFTTTLKIAKSSKIIEDMIKDLDMDHDKWTDEPLTLTNVHSSILEKVIEFGEHYNGQEDPKVNEEGKLSAWDEKFWTELMNAEPDKKKMYDVILAANFLNMKNLLDSGCQFIANMMKGKKPDEIRGMLNIKNDFTPEEYAKIVAETAWAFE